MKESNTTIDIEGNLVMPKWRDIMNKVAMVKRRATFSLILRAILNGRIKGNIGIDIEGNIVMHIEGNVVMVKLKASLPQLWMAALPSILRAMLAWRNRRQHYHG